MSLVGREGELKALLGGWGISAMHNRVLEPGDLDVVSPSEKQNKGLEAA